MRFALCRTRVRVEIVGFNQPRLLSALKSEGVAFFALNKNSAQTMRLSILKKDCVKTFAICNRMCYNYVIVGTEGVLPCIKASVRRVGVLVGALMLCALTAFSGSLILDVKVEGLESITRAEMLAYLKANGVSRFAPKSKVDADAVKLKVNAYDGVAECTVKLDGSTLTVTVIEREHTADIPTPKPLIVSRYDARVTRIVAREGTPTVKCGDIVKIGQTLIEGVAYDQNGEVLVSTPADGEVYGSIALARTFTVSADEMVYRPTGRKATRTQLNVFGKSIGKLQSPFEHCTAVTRTSELNAFLPVSVTQITYSETERITLTRDANEIADELKKEVLSEYVGASEVAVDAHVKALSANTYQITVYLQAEILISD